MIADKDEFACDWCKKPISITELEDTTNGIMITDYGLHCSRECLRLEMEATPTTTIEGC